MSSLTGCGYLRTGKMMEGVGEPAKRSDPSDVLILLAVDPAL
jgi:hypothetical protein